MKIKEMTDLQVCLMFILAYIVLFALVWSLFKLIKWIKNKRKWARAKRRGLERFPIGSTVIRSTTNGKIKLKVINVWASHYKYEDAFCIRFEDEWGDQFRLVEGDPNFNLEEFEVIEYPESTKLD